MIVCYTRFLVYVSLFSSLLLWTLASNAQCPAVDRVFERPACPAGNPIFEDGTCSSTCNWPRACSHCRITDCNVCTDAETLNVERGVCISVRRVETGRPACPAGNPIFEDGSCNSRCGWPRACSHCRITDCNTCRPGERLDTTTGRCCPGP